MNDVSKRESLKIAKYGFELQGEHFFLVNKEVKVPRIFLRRGHRGPSAELRPQQAGALELRLGADGMGPG